MDGRLCFWNVTSFEDPEVEWELMHRDTHKVVSKQDVGEWNGSDVADRSLYPGWSHDGKYLAIPGENFLQFRRKSSKNEDWSKKECMALKMGEKIGEIVSLAHDPKNEGYVVTSGRDGKICLWQITKGETMKVSIKRTLFCSICLSIIRLTLILL
jgi:WD40 repeat protein